jgi:hypothetical protein
VDSLAEDLQGSLEEHMLDRANRVVSQLKESAGLRADVQVIRGGPGQLYHGLPTEHWYHFQVFKTAQETNQRVNFDEHHYFVRTRISGDEIPWLTFVISFHHIGQELSGVMEVTSFAEISYPRSEETSVVTDSGISGYSGYSGKPGFRVRCMDKPFTMTYKDDPALIRSGLLDWANECFTLAVKSWGDVL